MKWIAFLAIGLLSIVSRAMLCVYVGLNHETLNEIPAIEWGALAGCWVIITCLTNSVLKAIGVVKFELRDADE